MSPSSRRSRYFAAALAVALLPAAVLRADVKSPRVVSQHTADAWSMKTFARFDRWRELEGDARAWEMFRYLSDKQTGLYPMGGGPREGKETAYQFGLVRDPVKILNVYGTGYCDIFGPVMAGIWQEAGFGPARVVDIPEWKHVTAEVFCDNAWHYLDLDVRAAFRRSDGRLASLAEARRDPALWTSKSGPRFFPMDDIDKVREIYASCTPRRRYGVHTTGHTMDYMLRQGERFTRWWRPQQDRWSHHPDYNKRENLKQVLAAEPKGPKSKHASFTVHTHGNGRYIYQPNLTAASSDFADGVYESHYVQPAKTGLTLKEPGEGFAVFEVRSPYIIVPLVGDPEKTDDDKQASVVELDGKGISVRVSRDNAATWEPITTKEFPATIDLTAQVAGSYGYLLKITLNGKPDEAVLKTLKITTWVQVAPASLPALRKGTNRMQFKTGDHYGLPTRVVEYQPESSDVTEFSKQLVIPPENYDPAHPTRRIEGSFVMRVAAAPGTKIAWFTAGGSFYTHQQEQAKNTANSIAYSTTGPADFQEIYRADLPTDVEHWHYNASKEIRLDEPAETVYLKYIGDPAVNNVRIYAHCLEAALRSAPPLTITHTWRENGERKTFSTTRQQTGDYEIEVIGEPVNESIEFAVASDG